jgi:hypothetical protein
MKTRSKLNRNVYYDHWKTPLDKDYPIHHYLAATLIGANKTYFFFGVAEKPFRRFHVMTVTRLTPFRVYEEEAFDIGLYAFVNNMKPRNGKKIKYKKHQQTWKFWNTQFIKEFDKGDHPFSIIGKGGGRDRICHHVIITSNEAVEFLDIYYPPPRWEYYENTTIKALLKIYATKRFYD